MSKFKEIVDRAESVYPKNRSQWVEAFEYHAEATGLHHAQIHLGNLIASHTDAVTADGSWPGQQKLADGMGYKPGPHRCKNLTLYVRRLETTGWLEVDRRQGRSSVCKLTIPRHIWELLYDDSAETLRVTTRNGYGCTTRNGYGSLPVVATGHNKPLTNQVTNQVKESAQAPLESTTVATTQQATPTGENEMAYLNTDTGYPNVRNYFPPARRYGPTPSEIRKVEQPNRYPAPLRENWQPTAELVTQAVAELPGVTREWLQGETYTFVHYYRANGRKVLCWNDQYLLWLHRGWAKLNAPAPMTNCEKRITQMSNMIPADSPVWEKEAEIQAEVAREVNARNDARIRRNPDEYPEEFAELQARDNQQLEGRSDLGL